MLQPLRIIVLLSLFATAPWLQAKDLKIAIADTVAAAMASEEAKVAVEKLRKELSDDESKLLTLQKTIKNLQAKYEKDAAIMSENESRKLKKEVEDHMLDYNFLGKKLQKSSQEGQQEILKNIRPKLEGAIKTLIEKGKYDVILQRQAAIYFDDSIDITDEITKKINAL